MILVPSEDSDQPEHPPSLISLRCPHEETIGSSATHWVHCEDTDQTGRMPRLIWVFPVRTYHFVGFVTEWLNFVCYDSKYIYSAEFMFVINVFINSFMFVRHIKAYLLIIYENECKIKTKYIFLWSLILVSKWTASRDFGTYHLCEQRRFRRACASTQSRQNLRFSLIQAVSQEEPSDRKPDPWPLWMSGRAQLKFVMTECSKTQIYSTELKWQEHCCTKQNASYFISRFV